MHESVKAKEIEKEIRRRARLKGLKKINKVVLRAGRACGESAEDILHIVKEHMNIDRVQIIPEEAAIRCTGCGSTITSGTDSLACPSCGSIETEIISGMGFKVLKVE